MSSPSFESRIAALQNANAGSNPLSQIATQMQQQHHSNGVAIITRRVEPEEFESFMAAAEASKGGFDVLAQQHEHHHHHHHHHQQNHRPQLSMSDSTMTPISDADLAKKYRELKVRETKKKFPLFCLSLEMCPGHVRQP